MTILLRTNLRRKLLSYTFTHQDESYYVRELAGLINEDHGNLSRELKKLEKEGLFKSYVRGNSKFYTINKRYPLYKELKKIIFKTEGMEGSLRDVLSAHDDIIFACIYGSYAKNKEGKTSDVDLLLIGKINESAFTRDICKLESIFSREINFTCYNKEEFDKERNKKGGFVNLVINDKKTILKGNIDDR